MKNYRGGVECGSARSRSRIQRLGPDRLSLLEKLFSPPKDAACDWVAKKSVGRPSVCTPITLAKLEMAFKLGCNDREACFYAGINVATLYRYMDANPEFREQKDRCQEFLVLAARMSVADAILNKKDNGMIRWYLERKRPNEFSRTGARLKDSDKTGRRGSHSDFDEAFKARAVT